MEYGFLPFRRGDERQQPSTSDTSRKGAGENWVCEERGRRDAAFIRMKSRGQKETALCIFNQRKKVP